MRFFNPFRHRGTAPIARERLKILLSHERAAHAQSDLLAILRKEILVLTTKYVTVESHNIQVRMERGATVSTLEINVEIPHSDTFLLGTPFEARTRPFRLHSEVCAHG
jgi:cell division topological specificity factor